MSENFHYDVFLSHSSKDKAIVHELAERLRADGVRVWFDDGSATQTEISNALEQSRILLLAISANASESDWVEFEHQTVLFNDPTNKQRRFIPLKIDDSESKFHLKKFAYIDWRNHDEEEYQRLLSVIFEGEDKIEPPKTQRELDMKIKTVRILKGHQKAINSDTVSSDGKFIVSGSSDETMRIWDLATGQCLKTLVGHSDSVLAVAVSSDGKFIVSGSSDETVRIWDLATGQCLKTLVGHSDSVWGVAVSSDGKFIVSGSSDETVRIWDLATGQCLKTLVGHSDSVWG
ncbi:MAG: TIR domain-containing protein, partial [Pyrinomonadaceae bacterium]|nr:TIR domain-containing protein [Pyrinomonadaceae bacterium]